MSHPLVTIILATYNRAEWLPVSIGSVLSQSFMDWELIVWDDGSQDDTRAVVNSYKDPRIRYAYGENHGQSYAINQALLLANGNYIAFLDDDDRWYPEKLSIQVEIMEEFEDIDVLFSNFNDILLVPPNQASFFEQKKAAMGRLSKREVIPGVYLITAGFPERLLSTNFILPSSAMIRMEGYKKNGLFNENLKNGQDLEYWWRYGLLGAQFAYVDKIVVDRVKPPDSLSSYKVPTYVGYIKALDFCLEAARRSGRTDLEPFFREPYSSAWQELIRLNALQGNWKQTACAFGNSLRYGFQLRSLALFFLSVLGAKIAEMVILRRSTRKPL